MQAHAKAVTFGTALGSVVTFVDVSVDGFLLGAGAAVDESELKVVGFERKVGYQEAKRVLKMEDAQRSTWLDGNPLATTALEFMLTSSDGGASGHIGTLFVESEALAACGSHSSLSRL